MAELGQKVCIIMHSPWNWLQLKPKDLTLCMPPSPRVIMTLWNVGKNPSLYSIDIVWMNLLHCRAFIALFCTTQISNIYKLSKFQNIREYFTFYVLKKKLDNIIRFPCKIHCFLALLDPFPVAQIYTIGVRESICGL